MTCLFDPILTGAKLALTCSKLTIKTLEQGVKLKIIAILRLIHFYFLLSFRSSVQEHFQNYIVFFSSSLTRHIKTYLSSVSTYIKITTIY